MAVTPTSFQAAYPEFADTSTVNIQASLTRAELRVATAAKLCTTEAIRDELVSLLTAHLLSISDRSSLSAGSGQIQTIDIDDAYRVEFARSTNQSGYQSTAYGQEFEILRNSLVIPFTII